MARIACWNAQEGGDLYFRPFCMRFRSPDFTLSSTPMLGLTSLGSGASQPGYLDIRVFLSGEVSCDEAYLKMFGDTQQGKRYWTVSKFKNVAARQAQTFDRPGISRSTTACTGTIDFGSMLSAEENQRLRELMPEIGVVVREERTSNDILRNYEISIPETIRAIASLRDGNPKRADEIYEELASFRRSMNYDNLFKLPHLEEFQELIPHERPISPLLSDWDSVRALLEEDGVDLANCSAIA